MVFSHLSSYSMPIITAVTIFPIVVCIISLPFLVYNYRKYKGLSLMRATVIFSFVFYMMCAFFLTLLPLPTIEEVLERKPVSFNYHLFNNIQSTLKHSGFIASDTSTWFSLHNWKKMLTSAMLFQIVANIVMQIPLGFYLRYYFRTSWKKALGIGFLVSFFFEMTQLSGVWGIYPYAFRCPDIDDLMNNTLGCMIGFWAAPILMHFLPSVEEMDEIAARRGQKLEIVRSFTAFSIDWILVVLINVGTNTFVGQFLSGLTRSDVLVVEVVQLLLWILYFYIIPKIFKIQTIGTALVGIKIVSDNPNMAEVSFKTLILRYLAMFLLEPMAVFTSVVFIANTAYSYVSDVATNLERALFTGLSIVYFPIVFAVLINSIRKKGGLPHDTWTKTHFELKKTEK